MIYRDLLPRERESVLTHAIVHPKVLAWSVNYETAVFSIEEEIHRATEHVWFQMNMFQVPDIRKNLILKVKVTRVKGMLIDTDGLFNYENFIGELLEDCWGNVPFKNEVVFTKHPKCLYAASAAGNTAEAVFPQNMDKIWIE